LLNNYLNFHESKINTFGNILKSMFKNYMISIPGILLSIDGAGFAYIVLQKTHLFHYLLVFSLTRYLNILYRNLDLKITLNL